MRARSVVVAIAVALLLGGGAYVLLSDREPAAPDEPLNAASEPTGSRAPTTLDADPVAARKREADETKRFVRGLLGRRDDKPVGSEGHAQSLGQSNERREPPGRLEVVRGIVVDEEGNPVREATVWAEASIVASSTRNGGGGCVTATSDADGRFTMAVPARSWGQLRARAGTRVSRDVQPVHDGARIVVVASVALTVRVTAKPSGSPVADAELRAFTGATELSRLSMAAPVAHAATNADGSAVLTVPTTRREDTHVFVSAAGYAPAVSAAPEESAGGWSVAVALGEGGTIKGRVSDASGAPVADAEIVAGERRTTTGADGRYQVNHLPVAAERLSVSASTATGRSAADAGTIDREGAVLEVDLRLRQLQEIEGAATYSDGSPASGLLLIPVPVESLDDLWRAAARLSATTDARGQFSIAAVPPGRYSIVFWRDGTRIWSETMDVPDAGQAAPLTVRIPVRGFSTGTLRVRVTDAAGRAAAKATVLCEQTYVLMTTGDDGLCTFSSVPRTVVAVQAWLGTGAHSGADADVTLGNANVTIRLGDAEITGRVVSEAGGAKGDVSAEWISSRGEAFGYAGPTGPTDGSGGFRIAGVGEGRYRLRFRAQGSTESQEGPIVRAGDRDIVFHVLGADAEKRREFIVDATDTEGNVLAPSEVGLRLHTEKGPASDFLRAAPILGVLGSYRGSLPADLPAGEYTLTIGAEKPYAGVRLDGVRLAPELGPYRFKVAFGRGPSVNGHVVWADGRPAQYAKVYSKESSQPDERSRAPVTVGADGAYFIDALEEGPLTVFVREPYALVARKTIMLGTTGTSTVDFRLEPAGGVRLVFPERLPRTRCDVTLTPASGGDARTLSSGGRLESLDDVAPGRYRAAITWDGEVAGATEIDVVAGSTTPLVLPLK